MSQRAAYIERQMISLVGKAAHGWGMIADNDRIAVGLSGGKDSLGLLWLLVERRRRIPIDFAIEAIHIEMGFGTVDHKALEDFCAGLGVGFHLIERDYGPRAFTSENREKSPCFFCSLNRRKDLFKTCAELNCGKLALAHHQDDIHETFLMNLLYAGKLATMLPVQPFFGGKIIMIRPLSLAHAGLTRRFAEHKGFPVQPPCCPAAGESRRGRVREMLESLYRENKKVRPSVWGAISNAGLPSLPPAPSTQRPRRRKKD